MVSVLRDAGLSNLLDDTAISILAEGFQFTEGPLWLADGALLFQDIADERTYRLEPGGAVSVLREATGAANGQTFAPGGHIVFCEQTGRRVSTMRPDGSDVQTFVETFEGRRLNSPNDVVCRSDGQIYFTDPPYGVPQLQDKELDFNGVFRIDRQGELHLLTEARAFEKPNGLAFSPTEKTLYVADTAKYHIRAFEVDSEGDLIAGSDHVFATLDPADQGGPDGIKVDRDGRVYVAVAQGVWVYGPAGRLLGILELPKRPSNLAWCASDARALAITAIDTVYWIRLRVAGIAPPFLPGT